MSAKKRTRRGLFIVLEGIDGAGTTTQIGQIMEWMRKRGELAMSTAQPTAGPIGSMLRLVLNQRLVSRVHKTGADPMDPAAVALLFAADRLDHLQQCPASQLHAVLRRLVAVVLLKVLLDSLLVAPDGHGLPCGVVARRLCLVELRLACRAAGPTRLGAEPARTPAG